MFVSTVRKSSSQLALKFLLSSRRQTKVICMEFEVICCRGTSPLEIALYWQVGLDDGFGVEGDRI